MKAERYEVTLFLVMLAIVIGLIIVASVINTPCLEDMACWDCRTMGNRMCGPVVPS
jgi:hypothetical protein